MEPLEHGSYTLSESCEECRAKWVESGLVKAMKDIKWHLVRRRQDIADLVYIYIYIYIYKHCVIMYACIVLDSLNTHILKKKNFFP